MAESSSRADIGKKEIAKRARIVNTAIASRKAKAAEKAKVAAKVKAKAKVKPKNLAGSLPKLAHVDTETSALAPTMSKTKPRKKKSRKMGRPPKSPQRPKPRRNR